MHYFSQAFQASLYFEADGLVGGAKPPGNSLIAVAIFKVQGYDRLPVARQVGECLFYRLKFFSARWCSSSSVPGIPGRLGKYSG